MKFRNISTLVMLICFSAGISAQIIAPDTVCVGTTVNFSTNNPGKTYTWHFQDQDITPTLPPAGTLITSGSQITPPSFTCIVNDNNNWYIFTTNYFSGNITRIAQGNSPFNTPASIVNLGNFGMNGGICGGIDIVKDDVSGNWYGFVVNNTQMLRLEFGNSITNTPTSAIMNFSTTLAWPHEYRVKKFGNQWIGFVANRSGSIARFDYGTALTNVPTSVNLPVTNLASPVSYSLMKDGPNWYMFVANLYPASIARFDFGSNIQNNTPTSVNFGNYGGQLSLTRHIIMVRDCNQIFGYANNEYAGFFKLDFNNNITNPAPVLTSLGSTPYNNLNFFAYNNTLSGLLINGNGNQIKAATLQTYGSSTFTNYNNSNQSYTFTTPGIYNVGLTIDQGTFLYNQTYCKQIVVVNSMSASLGPDTSICGYPSFVITPTSLNATDYIWSTGDTTQSITVTQSGTYWLHTSGNNSCNNNDSIHVSFHPAPSINIVPKDTTICAGESVIISASGAATYQWSPSNFLNNPNLAAVTASPPDSITYYLLAKDSNNCYVSDSARINVLHSPVLTVTPHDTAVCIGQSVTISASGAATYLWSPATFLNNPNVAVVTASPPDSITYYLLAKDSNNCSAKDSVKINVFNNPVLTIMPHDTTICIGQSIVISTSGAEVYQWSPATFLDNPNLAAPTATPTNNIVYYLLAKDSHNCYTSDSVKINVFNPPLLNVSPKDTTVCAGESVIISASGAETYQWSPAAFLNNPDLAVVIASPPDSITYYLLAKDSNNCYANDSVKINILHGPIVKVSPEAAAICKGDSVLLAANANLLNYLWSPGTFLNSNNIPNPVATPTESIEYVLSSVGENGCKGTDTVKITVNQLPEIVASADKDEINCTEPFLHLYASGGISYKWTPFDILNNPAIADPVATLKDTTTFYVMGTDINGCTNSDSLTINLSSNKLLFVPNAFSPNGDGVNDEFLPKYNCDLDYIVFSVYNRFGQRVFSTGNKFVGWKGLQNGRDADVGTYFWIITGKDNSGKVIRKGDVTLIR